MLFRSERGVGQPDVVDNLSYLRTCRNTSGLRRVVLPQFIALGEVPRDQLGPAPTDEPSMDLGQFSGRDRLGGGTSGGTSADETPPMQESNKSADDSVPGNVTETANPTEHFRAWVGTTLARFFDRPDFQPDDDGDFVLPQFGSSQLFI